MKLLDSEKVEYLLVGGYAVGYYGYPRATGDIDIWVSSTRENAERLVHVLGQFGFNQKSLSEELFLKEHSVVRMGVPPVRIDLLTTITGVSFEDCYPNRVEGVLDGVKVSLISLNNLRENKIASGRPKDLSDLEYLK
ncbi:MAG: hypothetical protein JXM70_20415 [Pirellulales bacterium]|nr:hypothetical protein [Pirellulales bacterium]